MYVIRKKAVQICGWQQKVPYENLYFVVNCAACMATAKNMINA